MKNKAFIIGGIIACVLIIGGIIGWRLLSRSSGDSNLDSMEPVAYEKVSEDDAISEKEFMAILNEAFNYEDTLEYSDNKITGKEAVARGVDRLGPAYRDFLLEDNEDTPENRFDLVQKKGVLSNKFEEAYMSSAQAEAIITNFTSLASLEDYHVSKAVYEVADNVIDGTEWAVSYYTSHEDGSEEALIEIKGDAPSVGEKFIYLDTVGVLRGGIITAIEKRDGDTYDVLTTQAGSLDDMLSDFTVAGYVDWSKVDALNTEDGTQVSDTSSMPNYCFVSTKDDKGIRIETSVTVTGEVTISNSSSDGEKSEFQVTGFEIGGKDYSYLLDTFHVTKDYAEELKEEYDEQQAAKKAAENKDAGNHENAETRENAEVKENDSGDEEGHELSSSMSIELSLEDFQLYGYLNKTDGFYYELLYKPVLKMGDANINFSYDLPFPTVPIGPPAKGLAEIKISLGFHADMKMKNVGVVIGTEKQVGTIISIDGNGFSRNKQDSKIVADLIDKGLENSNANISVTAGVVPKTSFVILGAPIITPKLDYYLKLSAEELDVVPGYEKACWEAKAIGPLVDFYVTDDGEYSMAFFVAEVLKGAGLVKGTKIPVIEEADTYSLYYHVEFDNSPVLIADPNHDASVCTHVAADGSRSVIKRKVDFTLPKTEDKVDIDKKTAQLYQDFLDGKVKASVVAENKYPDAFEDTSKEYSFEELCSETLTRFSQKCEDWESGAKVDYDYSKYKREYIDCGKDNNIEMLLTFEKWRKLDDYQDHDWAKILLMNDDGKVKICYRFVIEEYSGDGGDGDTIFYYNGLLVDTVFSLYGDGYSCGFIDGSGIYKDWYDYTFNEVQYIGMDFEYLEDSYNYGLAEITTDDNKQSSLVYPVLKKEQYTGELPLVNQFEVGEDPNFIYEYNTEYASSFYQLKVMLQEHNDYWFEKTADYWSNWTAIDEVKKILNEKREDIGLTGDVYYME